MVWEQAGKQPQNKTSEERSCNDFEVASTSMHERQIGIKYSFCGFHMTT